MLIHLQGAPRRAPFSDWLSQVERIIARHSDPVTFDRRNQALQACYDVGLSPVEVADDFTDWKGTHQC